MSVHLTTAAYCHHLDCDWTAGPSDPTGLGTTDDEVDLRARRHTGEKGLRGALRPGHPTSTLAWPTRPADGDQARLRHLRNAHREHVRARLTLAGWTPPGQQPPSSEPTPDAP